MRVALLGVSLGLALSGACVSGAWAQSAGPDNWTGLYGGAHVGYGWGDTRGEIEGEVEKMYDLVPDFTPPVGNTILARDALLEDDYNQSNDGPLGGVHVGANLQVHSVVFGVEGDYDWADISGTTTFVPEPSINANTQLALDNGAVLVGDPQVKLNTSLDDIVSVRGRLGLALPKFLIYGTAGWAWAQTDLSVTSVNPAPGFPAGSFSQSDHLDGYVYGGGIEYRIHRNLSLRLEALHYEFGSVEYEFESEDATVNNLEEIEGRHDIDLTQVRAGLTFHFQ